MKTWTYEEITAETEKAIIQSMSDAKKHAADIDRRMNHEYMAMGAFHLWDRLTMGWRPDPSDEKRLKALADLD
ncbi:TPA: hypothetical protein ACW72U_004387 [Enterobacter ludwigii]|uniref:hypothetical protein n=1 Tax=Enterobacter asburiae TaxID=61645 RepID=UPI001F14A138|nr:hypothetical protein [Enterobacter asburiae]HDT4906532.1 hypothetical protein [Enterobacter ludwigii]HDW0220166.1 hypothetical protein [Enterobacter ludwigii]HDW0234931.1 hypothetical protein [Enterobacter ludwigii]